MTPIDKYKNITTHLLINQIRKTQNRQLAEELSGNIFGKEIAVIRISK
jgi:hypothetical protein